MSSIILCQLLFCMDKNEQPLVEWTTPGNLSDTNYSYFKTKFGWDRKLFDLQSTYFTLASGLQNSATNVMDLVPSNVLMSRISSLNLSGSYKKSIQDVIKKKLTTQ